MHQKLQQMASKASTRAAEEVLQMAVRRLLQARGAAHGSKCQQQQQPQQQAKPQNAPAVAQGGHSNFQQHPQQQQQLPQPFPHAQMRPTPDASWQHPQQGLQQQVFHQQRPQNSMDAPWQQQQWQLQALPAAPPTHSQEAHQLSQPQCNHLQLLDLGSIAKEVTSPYAAGANPDVARLHSVLTEIVELLQEEKDQERVCESNALAMRWLSFTSAVLAAQRKRYMLEGKCLLHHDRQSELSFSNEQSILYLFMRSPHWRSVFPTLVRRVMAVLAHRLSPDFLTPPVRFGNRSFHDELLYHKSYTCSYLP